MYGVEARFWCTILLYDIIVFGTIATGRVEFKVVSIDFHSRVVLNSHTNLPLCYDFRAPINTFLAIH